MRRMLGPRLAEGARYYAGGRGCRSLGKSAAAISSVIGTSRVEGSARYA